MIVSGRKISTNLSSLPFVSFHSSKPWKLWGTNLSVDCDRELQEMREKNIGLGGDILRKLMLSTRTLGAIPGDMVRKLLLFVQRGEVCNH